MYDIIILGSGPAGLTAAIYSGRGGKKTLVIGGDKLGGQMNGIPLLENYPGWVGSGLGLAELMKSQAEASGADIVFSSAKRVSGDESTGFTVLCDNGKEYTGKVVVLSTGAAPRKLEIEGARQLFGKGVSYCATCDGFFYSGRSVIVIGGGNSALNDALYLSDVVANVKIAYRGESFSRAEQILVQRAQEKENIEFLFNTEYIKIEKDEENDNFILTSKDDKKIVCDGVFVAIGHEANTDYLSEDIKRDKMGRLPQENLPTGMFVAGDVKSGLKMQIATAVGTGCEVAMDAILYLNSRKA